MSSVADRDTFSSGAILERSTYWGQSHLFIQDLYLSGFVDIICFSIDGHTFTFMNSLNCIGGDEVKEPDVTREISVEAVYLMNSRSPLHVELDNLWVF